ncbi:AlpA family transcriptional regulator [Acetobacter sp. DsW_063]|uniref:helix-turn-helix transcriptional regulator n=1 Tax=Acetobacter sp. DsW_063 TaxID=1514894 RepID=UPI000A3732DE|nr:hypothetical protein [Acetobacter sp. DsW_063]OUJ14557.1 hypothetical protein HK28_12925 [Acetobacter sp. DsW_063]
MRVLPTLPPHYLRTPDAANFLGLSGRTLEKHRTFGTGPLYRKLGGRIVYAVEDLCSWADLNIRLSTADDGVVELPRNRRAAMARIQARYRSAVRGKRS